MAQQITIYLITLMEVIKQMRTERNNSLIALEDPGLYQRIWGITLKEWNEAIIETGSLDLVVIRNYLVRSKVLISFWGVFYCSRKRMRTFFSLKKQNKVQGLAMGEKLVVARNGISHMAICPN
jgi:hypothetical protein